MGHRVLAPSVACDRHLLAVGIRPRDRSGHGAGGRHRDAGDERQIGALDGMVGELAGESFVRRVVLCYDQQAGCVLVNAMNNARARYAAYPGQLAPAVVQQRIDQRAVGIAGGGMDDEAGGATAGTAMRKAVPAFGLSEGCVAGMPSSVTCPSPSSAFTRSRDRPEARLSALSMRWPDCAITPSMMLSPRVIARDMGMEIEVTRGVIATLLAESARAAPEECCGLLLGTDERIYEVLPAANVAQDPLTRFEIDPMTLLAAHKAARGGGAQVLGYYHSHPAGHPVPSATDCDHASGDHRVWAIVSGDEVGWWQDRDGGFVRLTALFAGGKCPPAIASNG